MLHIGANYSSEVSFHSSEEFFYTHVAISRFLRGELRFST